MIVCWGVVWAYLIEGVGVIDDDDDDDDDDDLMFIGSQSL
jgi:hypothetical protein